MYKVELSTSAQADLKKLKINKGRQLVAVAIEDLKSFPLIGKPLTRELTGQRALKVNGYRIIYILRKKDRLVSIIKIKHRSVAYN